MAVVAGAVQAVRTVKSDSVQANQVAEVFFYVSGTYVQAENGILSGVPTLIQNSRRNGKTVTMLAVSPGQTASKESSPGTYMGLKTVAISTNDVTFEITDNHATTELAGAAMPAQARPFSILVVFTEA
jgi:hypothetical protein